ncbi:hypothetical protein RIF29_00443 [Crotalaria pallida]|uniref:Uncharacterized protein n=1 Tax=Crotalaria pallida TaxID=3830 RepID=A0AAN9IXH8_CROPI
MCDTCSMYGHDSKSCRKQTKKVWMEKKKPTREEIEELDDRLKLKRNLEEGTILEENRAGAFELVKDLIQTQSEENSQPVAVVDLSQEKEAGGDVSQNPGSLNSPLMPTPNLGLQFVPDVTEEEQWTPVKTRNKAKQRQVVQQGETPKSHLGNG